MSITSINDLLIEQLRGHLKAEGYSARVQRWYPAHARRLLDYCDSKSLAIHGARSEHVTQFLRRQYQLFCRRHGESPSFMKWRHRYTGAVHMLLRLVHGKWPIQDPPATALEAFHRDIVDDYDACRCASPHQAALGNLPVGIALTHPHQSLSVVVHFDLPSAHRPSGKKTAEGTDDTLKFEMPVAYFFVATGSITPIREWLLYADHGLAPLRRSDTGSYTPITKWILYAGR